MGVERSVRGVEVSARGVDRGCPVSDGVVRFWLTAGARAFDCMDPWILSNSALGLGV